MFVLVNIIKMNVTVKYWKMVVKFGSETQNSKEGPPFNLICIFCSFRLAETRSFTLCFSPILLLIQL